MTLGFMQKWPKYMGMQDEKTYFIEKIWTGFYKNGIVGPLERTTFDNQCKEKFGAFWDGWYTPESTCEKIHTIRHDESERWKPGMDIHFVINSRTKDRFQFAPVVKCTSVQTIEISCANHLSINDEYVSYYGEIELYGEKWGYALNVKIDGRQVGSIEVETLAKNDGFDSVYDFYKYFDKEFKGRLIHWTNLRY